MTTTTKFDKIFIENFKKEKYKMLEKCTICPHKCGINRTKYVGRCKSTDKIKIALYSTHNFEEPCISGENRFWNDFLFKL